MSSTDMGMNSTSGIAIGMNSPSGDPMNGAIDELRVWSRVLSPAEISAAAQRGGPK